MKRIKRVKRNRMLALLVIIILIISIINVIRSIVSSTKETAKVEYTDSNNMEENNLIIVDIEKQENTIENEVINEITNEETEKQNTIDNSNSNSNKNKGTTKYRLEVNCEQNVVNVYTKDDNGDYTNCVKVMLCSTGEDTPQSGTYSLKKYDNWEWKGLFGDVYGQYATQITGNILFHSVPYITKYDNASLEYEEYDKLGTSASMGCIRLTVENAKWIYDNCEAGTKVMFYQDSNPGPLGKPSEQKISSEVEFRNWDPTDPDSDNPWKNYEEKTSESESQNTVKNSIENEQSTNTQIENEIVNDITNTQIENEISNDITNTQSNNEKENAITNTQIENEINTNTTNKQHENYISDSKNEENTNNETNEG